MLCTGVENANVNLSRDCEILNVSGSKSVFSPFSSCRSSRHVPTNGSAARASPIITSAARISARVIRHRIAFASRTPSSESDKVIGMPTAAVEADLRHLWHHSLQHSGLTHHPPLLIERAEGCHLWDAEGNRYLDAMAGLWCVNVGYGRKTIADAVYVQM